MGNYIQKSDVEPTLKMHTGNTTFVQTLQCLTTSIDVLRALGRYIYFNSPFGSGVANLAGQIAARQDLFRDHEETVELIADRSVEVAAKIFSAAIDEFGDRSTASPKTHRSLAQATLKAAGCYFGCEPKTLNDTIRPNESTLDAMHQVRNNYGINRSNDEPNIFRGVGFHMCSEVLADEEFRILDAFLRAKHSKLVEHLEKTQVLISGVRHNAYHWIYIHTTVEADHFEAAISGANHALQFYGGRESPSRVKDWMLEGFAGFAATQTEFMEGLMGP
jgi:hypothetical protein